MLELSGMSKSSDFDEIEAGLIALHKSTFQHRAWETIQQRAGISLERANATLLKVVAFCDKQPCRMQDIAKTLGIEAPSVTRTVQELEAAGLLQRMPDANDKRAFNVSLTTKGEQQLAKLQAARRAHLAEALSAWSKDERDQFGKLLQRFAHDITNKTAQ